MTRPCAVATSLPNGAMSVTLTRTDGKPVRIVANGDIDRVDLLPIGTRFTVTTPLCGAGSNLEPIGATDRRVVWRVVGYEETPVGLRERVELVHSEYVPPGRPIR